MRKDPPFDMEYIYSTYILEQAEAEGTVVVIKPQSIRDCNEKYFATVFPQLFTACHGIQKCPATSGVCPETSGCGA